MAASPVSFLVFYRAVKTSLATTAPLHGPRYVTEFHTVHEATEPAFADIYSTNLLMTKLDFLRHSPIPLLRRSATPFTPCLPFWIVIIESTNAVALGVAVRKRPMLRALVIQLVARYPLQSDFDYPIVSSSSALLWWESLAKDNTLSLHTSPKVA